MILCKITKIVCTHICYKIYDDKLIITYKEYLANIYIYFSIIKLIFYDVLNYYRVMNTFAKGTTAIITETDPVSATFCRMTEEQCAELCSGFEYPEYSFTTPTCDCKNTSGTE